jgi:hypothetical protein
MRQLHPLLDLHRAATAADSTDDTQNPGVQMEVEMSPDTRQ